MAKKYAEGIDDELAEQIAATIAGAALAVAVLDLGRKTEVLISELGNKVFDLLGIPELPK
jgi:hypothetical protein